MCACGSQRLTLSLFLHDLDLFFLGRAFRCLELTVLARLAHQGASLGIHLSPFPQCPDSLLVAVVPNSAPQALPTESSPPSVHPSAHGGDTGRERQTVVLSAGQKWSWCFWLILVPSSHVCCSLSISSVAFSKSKSRRNKRTRQQSYNMPVSLRLAARLWADWDAKLIF